MKLRGRGIDGGRENRRRVGMRRVQILCTLYFIYQYHDMSIFHTAICFCIG